MIARVREVSPVAPPGYRQGLLKRRDKPGDACPFLRDQLSFNVIPQQEWQGIIDAGDNLSSHVWYISNQGSIGSCGSEGVNNILALIREQAGLPRVKFNPYAMYHFTSGGRDQGSTLADNLTFARDRGCYPMELWGRDKGWQQRPSEEATAAAHNYRIDEFYEITNWTEFGSALLSGWAIYWGRSGHALGATDLLNAIQFVELNSWGKWGEGTKYSQMDYGFSPRGRESIMWNYGCYAARTPIIDEALAA